MGKYYNILSKFIYIFFFFRVKNMKNVLILDAFIWVFLLLCSSLFDSSDLWSFDSKKFVVFGHGLETAIKLQGSTPISIFDLNL